MSSAIDTNEFWEKTPGAKDLFQINFNSYSSESLK